MKYLINSIIRAKDGDKKFNIYTYLYACTYIKSLKGYSTKKLLKSVAFREEIRVLGGITVGRKLFTAYPLYFKIFEPCKVLFVKKLK